MTTYLRVKWNSEGDLLIPKAGYEHLASLLGHNEILEEVELSDEQIAILHMEVD